MQITRSSEAVLPFPNDALNVKSSGYCGSGQTLTGSVNAESNQLTITGSLADFQVGQHIIIVGAGPLSTVPPLYSVSLATGLTNGNTYTQLFISPLPAQNGYVSGYVLNGGDQLIIGSGSITQIVTLAQSANQGDTTLHVNSFTANANYPQGTYVFDFTNTARRVGAAGTYTFGYKLVPMSKNGGLTAASVEMFVPNCPLNLTSRNTPGVGATAQYIAFNYVFDSTADAYALYRTTVPTGSNLTAGFISISSYDDDNDILTDDGLPVVTSPIGVPPTAPASNTGDCLLAVIQSISGNVITINATASTTVTNTSVYHDDTAVIQTALNTGRSAVYIPSGTFNCSNELHLTTSGQTLYGDGVNSLLRFLWGDGDVSIEASHITVRDLSLDCNKHSNYGITTKNVTMGNAIHDITVENNQISNTLQTGVYIYNGNLDYWSRIAIRQNLCIDALDGYWLQGNIEYVTVNDNKTQYTNYNYSGRGICIRNLSHQQYMRHISITGNVIRSGNHTSGIVIQGSGLVNITGNNIFTAGGIFGILCLGQSDYDEQTDLVSITGNHMETTFSGVAISLQDYWKVSVVGNTIRNFAYAFEVKSFASSPNTGPLWDSLSAGIVIADNALYEMLFSPPISSYGQAPLSVKFVNNSGLNPLGRITPPVTPLVSGTPYLNKSNVDVTIYQQVYAPSNGTVGTITVAVGATSTPTTLYTRMVSGTSTSSAPDLVEVKVPQGYYYEFTTTGATLGTTTIMGD